jgi:hypothetical protein
MFQPKYTLNTEWHDRRDEASMPFIRAIRTMNNRLPGLKPEMLRMFHEDFEEVMNRKSNGSGTHLMF